MDPKTTETNENNVVEQIKNATGIEDEQLEELKDDLNAETDIDQFKGMSENQIKKIIRQARDIVLMFEENWNTTKKTFSLNDTHMRLLYTYNENHRIPLPEGVTPEEEEKYDRYNGLDKITYEEVVEIFGEGHPIIGVQMSQTLDRLKTVFNDFFNWLSALREYNMIDRAYMQYIEVKEEQNMIELKSIMEKEEDPAKKEKMRASLENYYRSKYIDFLKDPLDKQVIDYLVKRYGDKKSIEYWLNRTRDRFKQMYINSKFILELSQFEKRYLPEKYHCISNTTLLYFMYLMIYFNSKDNPKEINKPIFMMLALDHVIRNITKDENRDRVINNVCVFLDQFIEPMTTAYPQLLKTPEEETKEEPKEEVTEEESQSE